MQISGMNYFSDKRNKLGLLLFLGLVVTLGIWYSGFPHFYRPQLPPSFGQILHRYHNHITNIKQPVFKEIGYTTFGPASFHQMSNGLNQSVKRILLWTERFKIKQWLPDVICKGQDLTCVTTTDKHDFLQSDALMMHGNDLTLDTLPHVHPPHQRWIYFAQESPHNLFIDLTAYNGVFNWTSTYRLDSDFPAVYYNSTALPKSLSDSEYKKMFTEILEKKSKLIATTISHCDTPHTNRLQFIKELKMYIPVDFYGGCGNLTCKRWDTNCSKLLSEYKFFIAFENSFCRDYITEKSAMALHSYKAVPIVMGGAHPNDYLQLMPPNSYLHFQGFSSVKELADLILLLDKNPTYYEHFHRWRQTHNGSLKAEPWCDICRALHNESLHSKVYTDFYGWYKEDSCVTLTVRLVVSIVLPILVGSVFSIVIIILVCKRYRGTTKTISLVN